MGTSPHERDLRDTLILPEDAIIPTGEPEESEDSEYSGAYPPVDSSEDDTGSDI